MEVMGNAYNILVRKPAGSRPFRRPRPRWEDNVQIYLKIIVFSDLD
jgi:hypothetical protein